MKKVILSAFVLMTFAASAQQDSTKKPVPVQSFKIWYNGQQVNATNIDVDCVQDDLATFARFYYVIKDSSGAKVADGNLEMRGTDYAQYSTQNNHAQRGTNWVIQQLNLARRAQVIAARTAAAGTATTTTAAKQ